MANGDYADVELTGVADAEPVDRLDDADDNERLNGTQTGGRLTARPTRNGCIMAGCCALFAAACAVTVVAVTQARGADHSDYVIAFGSCTAYDFRAQSVFTSVAAVGLDAWIWLGDMAYLDNANVNCAVATDSPECDCEENWLAKMPHSCMAGDHDHARLRWENYLNVPEYGEFLDVMCPGARDAGLFPPPGTDLDVCPKPILGIYDDHDFGWNNGDMREPDKQVFKAMFLDAVGEDPLSIRRAESRGAWAKHTLRTSGKSKGGMPIDVYLLDERYEREVVPCWTRRDFCDAVLSGPEGSADFAQCHDLFVGDDLLGGSCCAKDEALFLGWCKEAGSDAHPLFSEACDVSDPAWGRRMLVLGDDGPAPPTGDEAVDVQQQSPFCEVLGRNQRRWLRHDLATSDAPLKLIASGSVVMSNPQWQERTVAGATTRSYCSGDDFDCYSAAQQELLHLAATASGCVLILTGDYHWSEIKVLSEGAVDEGTYNVGNLPPGGLHQVMSSGLTTSTSPPETCEEFTQRGYTRDTFGLRYGGECEVLTGGSFATLRVGTDRDGALKTVRIELRGADGLVKVEKTVDVGECVAR